MKSKISLRSSLIVALNKNLVLKNFIKFFYYNFFYWIGSALGKRRVSLSTKSEARLRIFGKNSSFFGYYDFIPLNNGLVIYHELVDDTKKMPPDLVMVYIYVEEVSGGHRQLVAKTPCFNLQQGARTNWLDGGVIYNTAGNAGEPLTVVANAHLEATKLASGWHYQTHDNHRLYFVNYYHIAGLRPDYGYFNSVKYFSEAQAINAISTMKVGSCGDPEIVITEDLLRERFGISSEIGVELNHLMPSPDGAGFVFILRRHWERKRDGVLLYYDNQSGSLKQLTPFGIVSHVAWRSSSTLFGYFQTDELGLTYQSLDVNTGEIEDFSWITAITKGDGHPSFASRDVLFTDTYPDKYGIQRLFRVDLALRTVETVLENFHNNDFRGETRCDFHPRAVDDHSVFVDAIVQGVRKLVYLQLKP